MSSEEIVENYVRPPAISSKTRWEIGVAETQIAVTAKTLVVANNIGFQRRGRFAPDRKRITLLENCRKL